MIPRTRPHRQDDAALGCAARPAASRAARVPVAACVLLAGLVVPGARISGDIPAQERPILFVAPEGNDTWSGRLDSPNPTRTDGPFATVERARDELRRLRRAASDLKSGATTVGLRAGVYRMTRPFTLGPEDSGSADAPVVYAAHGPGRPVLSGGRRISGWKPGADGLWRVELPEVRSGAWYFHQLFVDGRRRVRARTPNEGWLRARGPAIEYKHDREATRGRRDLRDAFRFRPGDLDPAWEDLSDANLFLYHSWTNSLHWIERIDADTGIVRLTNPTGWPIGWWEREQRYHVENVRAALDLPGEWCLQRRTGTLFYRPLPGEDMARVEIVAPVLDGLVRIEGVWEERRPVHHVAFRGIAFQHADWRLPDRAAAADGQSAAFVPGTVALRGAEDVAFDRCEIAHVGGYGIFLESGCKRVRVVHCEIHDLGAGGIRIGEVIRQTTRAKDGSESGIAVPGLTFEGDGPRDTGHNTIENNFVHDGGHVFAAGTSVFLAHTGFNEVAHNEICDFLYSGVCVGWVWGFGRSVAHHNRIVDNHIHHLGWGVLSDMAGVYTLGPSPGTVVARNHIHHVNAYSYGGWGLYTDEGSSEIVMEQNVVHDTKTGGFHQHYGRANVIRNNVLAFSRETQVQRSREDVKNHLRFERNIVFCDNDQVLGRMWRNGDYALDHNVYWSTAPTLPLFDDRSFDEWRASSGQDAHSIFADPRFVDAHARDFRLRPDSPALALGFKPIDPGGAGLRGEPAWVAAPRKIRRPEFNLPPTAAPIPGAIRDDFEETPPGRPPAGATIVGEQEGAGTIRIDDTVPAAAGRHSLRFTDAPGLAQPHHPYLHYALKCPPGIARAGFDIRRGAGFSLRHEWRDGTRAYRIGPRIEIGAGGELRVGTRTLATLPAAVWVRIEIECGLGPNATGTFDLSIAAPGELRPRRFERLPCASAEFDRLRWLGFICTGRQAATLHLDNLNVESARPPTRP